MSALQPGHLFYLLTCCRVQTPFNWVLHKGGEGIPFMGTSIPLPLSAGQGSAYNDLGGCVQLLCKHSPCLDLARLHSGCMAPWCSLREQKKTKVNFWEAAKCNRPFEGGLGRWIKTIWIFFVTHSSFFKASRKSFWNARGRIRMAIKGAGELPSTLCTRYNSSLLNPTETNGAASNSSCLRRGERWAMVLPGPCLCTCHWGQWSFTSAQFQQHSGGSGPTKATYTLHLPLETMF